MTCEEILSILQQENETSTFHFSFELDKLRQLGFIVWTHDAEEKLMVALTDEGRRYLEWKSPQIPFHGVYLRKFEGGDWMEIYVDQRKVYTGHPPDDDQLLDLLKIQYEVDYAVPYFHSDPLVEKVKKAKKK